MNETGRGEGVVERGVLHHVGDCNNVGYPSSNNGTTNQGPENACHAPQDARGVVCATKDVGTCNVMTTTTSTMAGTAS